MEQRLGDITVIHHYAKEFRKQMAGEHEWEPFGAVLVCCHAKTHPVCMCCYRAHHCLCSHSPAGEHIWDGKVRDVLLQTPDISSLLMY